MRRLFNAAWFCKVIFVAVTAAAAGCGGSQGGGGAVTIEKSGVDPAISTAGQPIVIAVIAKEGGVPKAGVTVVFSVELGAGSLSAQTAVSGTDGSASVSWTIGLPPVKNTAVAVVQGADAGAVIAFETMAKVDKPFTPYWYADVNKFMSDNGLSGSTEDLAFSNDGKKIYLGIPGGLLTVDASGKVERVALTGDKVENPLGIDFDTDGNLWIADSKGALRMMTAAGVVSTVLTNDGKGNNLKAPNFVMVGKDKKIYLSDTCLGKVLRYDPVLKTVTASVEVEHIAFGGPNGIAIDATGRKLYFSTENTAVMCGHLDVETSTKNSALFVVDITESSFGDPVVIKKDFAHFGDGMTFDAEGNLYVIFDNIDYGNFKLKDSTVWVMPAGTTQLSKFVTTTDRVLANLEFGKGEFGETTVYFALLTIAVVLPEEARGLNKIEVGMKGGNR